MPTLRLVVDTGFVGAVHEEFIHIPDDEWDAMSSNDRDNLGYEAAETLRDNHVDTYYEIADGDE
jgi:hypothetical protein